MSSHHEFLSGIIDSPNIFLTWKECTWDSLVFGFPVLQIDQIECRSIDGHSGFEEFISLSNKIGCRLASCRLSHDRLKESMLLEDFGFRFVEMVYQPVLHNLQLFKFSDKENDQDMTVSLATPTDIPEILEIAGKAYGNERFHMDPRLPSAFGDIRYQNWVKNTITHPTQKLYTVKDGDKLAAFFIIEDIADNECYWHLNAVNPIYQGQGYGRKSWLAMLKFAKEAGILSVRSSIAARNYRVLNLYAKLGFLFPQPSMTFHWISPNSMTT